MSPEESVLAGRNAVLEALQREPHRLERICVQTASQGLSAFWKLAAQSGVPVQQLPRAALQRMAGKAVHQGVVAIRSAIAYQDVDAMLAAIAPSLDDVKQLRPRLLMLDGIQDPRNYGAIVRSAVAFGVAGIIVPARGMAPLSPAMIKASSGTASRIPIARTGSLAAQVPALQERGYYVYGASTRAGASLWSLDWDRPTALVIGSEGHGLRRETARVCDGMVSIPMPGDVASLNASVAAGILLAFIAAG